MAKQKDIELKFSKQGFVRDVKDKWTGKRVREVCVGKEKYVRNNVWGTYNSTKNNDILHKSRAKRIRKCSIK